jgi:hypothetical protein
MELRSDEPQRLHAIAIDSRDAERVLRISFTRASLTSAGDMAITRGAVVPLDCTLSALDNAGQLGRVQLGPAEVSTPLLTKGEAAKRAKTEAAA